MKLAPEKFEVGKMPLIDASTSLWFSRTIPAGLAQTVDASYALAVSPAKALAIQSVLPSRRPNPAAWAVWIWQAMQPIQAPSTTARKTSREFSLRILPPRD